MSASAEQQRVTSPARVVLVVILAAVLALLAGCLVVPGMLFGMFFGNAKPSNERCLPGGGTSVINDGSQAPYTGEWMNPMVGRLTSPFGMRTHPVTGQRLSHSGQDIAAADNTPIHAAGSGTVTIAGKSSGGNTGFMVAIDHGGGIQSRYVHMWPEDIKVKVGQKVNVGDVVGLEGTSGQSTGPHLHFEIRINGKPTEPMAWMKAKGVTLGTGPNGAPAGKGQEEPVVQAQAPTSESVEPHQVQQTIGKASVQGQSFKSTDGQVFRPSAEQWENLQRVLLSVEASGMGKQAAVITIMTVIVESKARMYANSTVPESLNYPHQAVGRDHDSVGLFQQRPSMGWGSVKELMTVDYSTKKFLSVLKTTKGWKQMQLGDAAQAVQRSGVPDAYAKWESAATAIVNGQGANFVETAGADTASCGPIIKAPHPTAQPAGNSQQSTAPSTTQESQDPSETAAEPGQDPSAARAKIEQALSSKIGVPYMAGGRTPSGWDGNGMVFWAAEQAGVKGIPYVDAWTAGTEVEQGQGGDLVVCGQRPDGTWRTTGIMTAEGRNTFYLALEGQRTAKAPIPSSCKFYSLVG